MAARCLTARLACSLLVALFWFSERSHRQGPGVPISSLAPSPVKILSSRLPPARICSSYTRLSDRLEAAGAIKGEEREEERPERWADTHKLSPKFTGSRKPVRLSSFPRRTWVAQRWLVVGSLTFAPADP